MAETAACGCTIYRRITPVRLSNSASWGEQVDDFILHSCEKPMFGRKKSRGKKRAKYK